jgi:hypothetical protein
MLHRVAEDAVGGREAARRLMASKARKTVSLVEIIFARIL